MVCINVLLIAPPGSCSDGDIRLAKNSSVNDFSANGTIEVCYTGVWGAVCAEYGHWDEADGTVACRQLGYEILSKFTPIVSIFCDCYYASVQGLQIVDQKKIVMVMCHIFCLGKTALDRKRDWLTVVMMVLTWEILKVVN